MAIGCGAQCAKILLIVFNIVFWLSGAALLGLGIWMFVDKDISNYIKVFGAFEDGGAFIRYAAIVFIVAGAIVLVVGFLGCCGAIKESRCMLGLYIGFLATVIILEITAAILAALFRKKVTNDLQTDLKNMLRDHFGKDSPDKYKAFTEGMDYVQEELECCGIGGEDGADGREDYTSSYFQGEYGSENVPASCCTTRVSDNAKTCAKTSAHTMGCYESLENWVKDRSIILMVVGFVIAGIEIFGFIFAICLCRNVGEED